MYQAVSGQDISDLKTLLRDRKPARAIIGKAVKLFHEIADRPAAGNTIGKQLSIIRIPRDQHRIVESGYYSNVDSYTSYTHDAVLLRPERSWAIKNPTLRKAAGSSPLVGPKVGRNVPCPCKSGKKYKHCHGKR